MQETDIPEGSVLSREALELWHENGYVIVPNAVPPDLVRAVRRMLCEFQAIDLELPGTWYRVQPENQMAELNYSGMVELYHQQPLWDVRQHPRVYRAFAQLWEDDHLWVTIDRVNFNPPVRPDWPFKGFIHWDVDTSVQPVPFGVQGMLSLCDTPADQGGFQCVVGFPKRFKAWLETQPADRDPWRPDLEDLEVTPIPTREGDLLIWHQALPHGTAPNRGTLPRMAQYVSMFPAEEDNRGLRESRIRLWRECLSPEGFAFPGNDREREVYGVNPARLSELGRKLLGLDSWRG